MFKAPFSFEGRIRRTEYWLSQLIQIPFIFMWAFLAGVSEIFGIILWIPYIWFTLAYCTKRCHDRGNPGYWMIIPFYGIWMGFADSEPGPNQYGPNPKQNP
jgi:uncharacterized membrane protein YhaH (DUF805 family)